MSVEEQLTELTQHVAERNEREKRHAHLYTIALCIVIVALCIVTAGIALQIGKDFYYTIVGQPSCPTVNYWHTYSDAT